MNAKPDACPLLDYESEAPLEGGASDFLDDNFDEKKRSLTELDEFSTESEVAEVFKISKYTLASWRTQGKGPRFRKFGQAVRYKRDDLIEWANGSIRTHTD